MNKCIKDAQVTVLLEIDGEIHLVGMTKDNLDAVNMMVKAAAEIVVPTGRSQGDINKWLGFGKQGMEAVH